MYELVCVNIRHGILTVKMALQYSEWLIVQVIS